MKGLFDSQKKEFGQQIDRILAKSRTGKPQNHPVCVQAAAEQRISSLPGASRKKVSVDRVLELLSLEQILADFGRGAEDMFKLETPRERIASCGRRMMCGRKFLK